MNFIYSGFARAVYTLHAALINKNGKNSYYHNTKSAEWFD